MRSTFDREMTGPQDTQLSCAQLMGRVLWVAFSRAVQIAGFFLLLSVLGMMAGPMLALITVLMIAIVPFKLLWDLFQKRTKRELLELVIYPFAFPVVLIRLAGLAAPAVAVTCLAFTRGCASLKYEVRLLLGVYASVFGICGLITALIPLIVNIPWRYKQLRQVQNLPRSKIRSAAMGLVELEGVAQPLHADKKEGHSPLLTSTRVEPFLLVDETGDIVVDPRGALVRHPNGLPILDYPICEVVMTKRAINKLWHVAAGELFAGDTVYVLGSLEETDPDSELAGKHTTIIRARRESATMGFLSKLWFFDAEQAGTARRDPHVFLLSDSSEWEARAHILHGIRRSLKQIGFWLACSAFLLWLAARFTCSQ